MQKTRGFGLNDPSRGRPSGWWASQQAWAVDTCGTASFWPSSRCRSTCTASRQEHGGRAVLVVGLVMPGIAAASEAPPPAVASGAWPGPPVENKCRLHYNGAPGTCNRRRHRAGPGPRRACRGRPPETCSGRIHYNRRRRRTASLLARARRQRYGFAGVLLHWRGFARRRAGKEWTSAAMEDECGSAAPRRRALGLFFGSAQQNRASVERHTSLKTCRAFRSTRSRSE